MKLIFNSTLLCILFSFVLTQYQHKYGGGHGGGHGFYGHPVGRKWGYSTYIKHPPPKHHYGGQHYGFANGFGEPGYGQSYDHLPAIGNNNYGHGYGGHPGYSHTYRHDFIPFDGFGFARKRRADIYDQNTGYNNYGQHKNHNYGSPAIGGVNGKTYDTRHIKPEFTEFGGFDSILGGDLHNYLIDLNLPDNFQQLIY